MSKFIQAFDNICNFVYGENGAPCHASTDNPGLDLFFKSVRDISVGELNHPQAVRGIDRGQFRPRFGQPR